MKKSILLVEDEALLRRNITEMLNTINLWSVFEATDAVHALEIIDELKPDLVISDYKMPIMNGVDFLNNLRQKPAYINLPVVFLTAKMDISTEVTDNNVIILHKPFSFKALIENVKTIMEINKARE